MIEQIQKQLIDLLRKAGVTGDISFTAPPEPEMGDMAFGCFQLAKEWKKSPNEVAQEIKQKLEIRNLKLDILDRVEAMGPYVNFFLNGAAVARMALEVIGGEGGNYGTHDVGKDKKNLVEFGCMNPMKAFHLGHLRNLITGESVARILENAGCDVVRVNYQGDVGMHIAKTLWGVDQLRNEFETMKEKPVSDRVLFLGKAYARGATVYEESDETKKEIAAYNEVVYGEREDACIKETYQKARQWSLDYFEEIYHRLGTRYDYYYFESEVFRRAIDLVRAAVEKGSLTQSQGAVIFEGSRYGLHDRVFLTQKGYPTYEGKEVALAERHFDEHRPDRVIHIVGKEQTEYFKVLSKALEVLLLQTIGKEVHLVGGYLQLKGDVKMSSRTGKVITGEELIEVVEKQVQYIMDESETHGDAEVKRLVAMGALKYAMLKVGVSDDMAFDMEQSVSLTGDSGPYLLYIVARIKSILKKAKNPKSKKAIVPEKIDPVEKQLLLKLAEFPEATLRAAETYDPSQVAKYLFDLAQAFNTFYHACPVLQAEEDVKNFRLQLIGAVEQVMTRGLYLLGIETVEEM